MEVLINFTHTSKDLESIEIEKLTKFILQTQGVPDNTTVSISFVTNEDITLLNKEYRNLEGPTDVLSFECDGLDDEMSTPQSLNRAFCLGDVIIAPDIARIQAGEYSTTFTDEITLLLVHGLLHLCGFDHIKDEDAHIMESLEDKLIKKWKEQCIA